MTTMRGTRATNEEIAEMLASHEQEKAAEIAIRQKRGKQMNQPITIVEAARHELLQTLGDLVERYKYDLVVNALKSLQHHHDYDEQTGSCYCGDVWDESREQFAAEAGEERRVFDHQSAVVVPKLVAALEDMIDLWKRGQKIINGQTRDVEYDSQVIAARAALALVKGRE